jgi:hypothetical protein
MKKCPKKVSPKDMFYVKNLFAIVYHQSVCTFLEPARNFASFGTFVDNFKELLFLDDKRSNQVETV